MIMSDPFRGNFLMYETTRMYNVNFVPGALTTHGVVAISYHYHPGLKHRRGQTKMEKFDHSGDKASRHKIFKLSIP